MKLADITEKESEKLFRRFVMDLSKVADAPFKPSAAAVSGGVNNEWWLESVDYKNRVWLTAHLINDEGENYVDLDVKVLKDDLEFSSKLKSLLSSYEHRLVDHGTYDPGPTGFWQGGDKVRSLRYTIYDAK